MTVEGMREALLVAYSGDKWKRKVWSMPDNQVIAVYKSIKGRYGKVRGAPGRKKMEPGIRKARQLSIFDPESGLTVTTTVDITTDISAG